MTIPVVSRRSFLQLGVAGAGTAVLHGALPSGGSASAGSISVPAGNGDTLVVEPSPFRLRLVDAAGVDIVATVPGTSLNPAYGPVVTGPEPLAPLGPLGGFPALGFVVAAHPGLQFPASYWTGNRLFGASGGAIVPVVGVKDVRRSGKSTVLALETDVQVGSPPTLTIAPLPGNGVVMQVGAPPSLPSAATMFSLQSPAGEGLYGLGGRKDAFDQRGLLRQVWTEEENVGAGDLKPVSRPVLGSTYTFPNGPQAAYYVQAALFGSRGWAAWIGQPALSMLDLAASRPEIVRWSVAERSFTLFLAGGGLEQASRSFTAVAGRAPAPPKYVYLPWMDVINQQSEGDAAPDGGGFTGGSAVRTRVLEVVSQSQALDLPVSVIGMEGWQAVPGVADLAASLREQGYHLSAYWNPFISPSNAVYKEAAALGVLVRDAAGQPFEMVDNRGSATTVVDFTNPKAVSWWRGQLERSMALGFEAFMHDYGEFVQQGMVFHDGSPPAIEHNAYPVQYHFAARNAVNAWAQAHPGFEPFFYVRSGFSNLGLSPGVAGATSGVFPGDELTDWGRGDGLASVVPCMLNLSLGGCFTFSTDVGGYLDLYSPQTTPELFTRWVQLASLSAVSRIHNSSVHGSVYPWDLGDEVVGTYRRYSRAKVKLASLVDSWSQEASTIGSVGPVRPLVLDDPAALGVGDQWLLGSDILVAPVLEEGATSRLVYLPTASRWQQVVVGDDGSLVDEGTPQDGGRSIEVPAPLSDIPIFLRV